MTATEVNLRNFEAWFGAPLAALSEDDDNSFILVMVTFPLLERYIRELSRSEPKTQPFNLALLQVLPELQTEQAAKNFWSMYRDGLLHKVTLSRERHGLSYKKPVVEPWPNGDFWLNPRLFAERVVNTIRADFATFERGAALAVVSASPLGHNEASTVFPPGGARR